MWLSRDDPEKPPPWLHRQKGNVCRQLVYSIPAVHAVPVTGKTAAATRGTLPMRAALQNRACSTIRCFNPANRSLASALYCWNSDRMYSVFGDRGPRLLPFPSRSTLLNRYSRPADFFQCIPPVSLRFLQRRCQRLIGR